jgi:competence protein ComEA
VYVSGAVSNPGFYNLPAGGSLGALVEAAGVSPEADLSALELHVPSSANEAEPQKININRAEAWLLEALPGIGEVRAQAVVAYREQHGAFNDVSGIVEAAALSLSDYEKLKGLITVAD